MPGFVDGKVTDILTKGQNVDGKSVKASKDVSVARPHLIPACVRLC